MLPEKVSTELTSLKFHQDRLSIVIEMVVGDDGSLEESNIYRALVHNHAKLAYHSIAAWLDGTKAEPDAASSVFRLDQNLRLQDKAAQDMKNIRHIHGARILETIEATWVIQLSPDVLQKVAFQQ